MTKIVLDMDGVLADFNAGACEVHNRPLYAPTRWAYYEDWGITEEDFWRPIKELGASFYKVCVPTCPWKQDILNIVRYYDPEFLIATANPMHAGLLAGKVGWLNHYVGPGHVMIGDSKHLLASEGRILIDDNDDNVRRFRDHGGSAVTFPQPWNVLHSMCSKRVDHVQACLDSFFNYGGNRAA